ncbi:cytochrome d ubiquinol oxidase subunit II [Fructilactobacillus sp. Tb1]|uniref:cytochrome d ubiquinol oxidase subunit II n=1 Tax=Fructilactobacillus sp. Tb1 TaxID=3422304 RepID=UPI003D2DB8EB
MSFLQLLWYAVIGLLFILFLVLDGADFGVGMATRFLASNYTERKLLLRTIGPHWNGNEVFLVTAGGAMFASLPGWYASLFSGFYLLLFLVLVGLIFRGVSFEFSDAALTEKGKRGWLWVNFISCLILPFLLGMLFTAMIQPLPMDAAGNIYVTFWNVVNPLSILGGICVTAVSLYQGLSYIALHTEGLLRYHASRLADNLYWAAYPVEVLIVIALYFQTDFYETHLVATLVFLVLIVAATVIAQIASATNHEITAYVANSSLFAFIVMLIFTGLFPDVLIAINPAHTLLIKEVSASPYTLTVMTIVLVILLPIMLSYFIWSYVSQWHRISLKEFKAALDKGEEY